MFPTTIVFFVESVSSLTYTLYFVVKLDEFIHTNTTLVVDDGYTLLLNCGLVITGAGRVIGGGVFSMKLAVTVLFAFISTVQVVPDVFVHPPVQFTKDEPGFAVAVRVTLVPAGCGFVPAPVIDPNPVPAVCDVRVKVVGFSVLDTWQSLYARGRGSEPKVAFEQVTVPESVFVTHEVFRPYLTIVFAGTVSVSSSSARVVQAVSCAVPRVR